MVAITGILAAVIATFVFGMAGDVSATKNVAATAIVSDSQIIVTNQGRADAADVAGLTVTLNGTSWEECEDAGETGELTPSVGSKV
ncbi:MAG: type IV pilin N-terminal domain-containing protein [Methanomicrobiales archaeon]|nr:type IV pilin N-terminal domain-containing protein [Methanomicrobiales archaeon]MDI6876176.1 type IV pilin N-terminal domain-containing protein [Methanomicrobiales archaeon]